MSNSAVAPPPTAAAAQLRALRLVNLGLLVSWLVKLYYFIYGALVYHLRPLADGFFPQPLQQLPVLCTAYALPIGVGLFAGLRRSRSALTATMGAFACGSLVLLLHQGTFNDATFVTSLWVALIGLWWGRRPPEDPGLAAKLAFLSQLFVGLLFLGGFIGKLTPGFLDGQVFYELYIRENSHPTFAALRALLPPEQLPGAAQGYAWLAVLTEGALATVPLWAPIPALRAACCGLLALPLLNNPLLLSVVAAPIALCIAALGALNAEAAP